jgi:hypothetical protein
MRPPLGHRTAGSWAAVRGQPTRLWATRALFQPAALVLCHWAASRFSPLAFVLFFCFLNIFKSLQIKKFV